MRNFKFSKYNHIVKYNSDYIVFNTLCLSMVLLDEKNKILLENNDIDTFIKSLEEKDIVALKENGIIVDAEIDETKVVKDAYWFNKYNDETLHISVLTTLACNFGCPYCFETRRNVQIDEKIETAIINFALKQIKGKKYLHLDWYGGEPLLNYPSIERISRALIAKEKEFGYEYYATITTNGYLLNKNMLMKLVNLKLRSAQITIDGPKEIHDKMRPLKNKEGTFDVILQNIKYASDYIDINLRININKNSYKHVNKLLDQLVGIKNVNVAIKAIVSASYKEYEEETLTSKDFAKIVIDKYIYAQKIGLKTAIDSLFAGSLHRYCIVDSDSQFIISPTGKLFKCGESYLDDEPGIIGGMDIDNNLVIDEYKKTFWDKDPFAYEECKDCKILPLCYGGCQMKRLVKNEESCHPEFKYALDDLIVNYYERIVDGQ